MYKEDKEKVEQLLKDLGYRRIDNKEDWDKYLFCVGEGFEYIEFTNQNFWVKDTGVKRYDVKWFNTIKLIDGELHIFINNFQVDYGIRICNPPCTSFILPALFLSEEIDNLIPIKNLIANGF